MNVNDKRMKDKSKISFEELDVGQVYEDKDGVLCIKTSLSEIDDNCICFVNGNWEANLESLGSMIIPLTATLEIER